MIVLQLKVCKVSPSETVMVANVFSLLLLIGID